MKKKHITVISAILIAIVVVTLIGLSSGKNGFMGNKNQAIELAYGFSLQVPSKYADMAEHTQEYFNGRITDAFVLKNGEAKISLFRLDFGDRESGDWLGELHIDGRNVPVTYTIFAVSQDEFTKLDEDTKEAYAALQEGFTEVLRTIIADPRFLTEEGQTEVTESREVVEMEYWSVSLVNGITFVETNQNGNYQADFFGSVLGEQIRLYSVRIGDEKLQTDLGLFEIDGVKKPVSVESYPLSDQNDWDQSDFELAYRMMDTINHVIETITQSKQFSTEAE